MRLPPIFKELNPRQQTFTLLVHEGKPASNAYVEAGYKGRNNVAEAEASKLLRNPKVRLTLQALRRREAERAALTVDDILAELEEARDAALDANPPQTMAAVQASMGKARILGMVTDKLQVEVRHKPSLLPTKQLELTEEDWQRQFNPALPPPNGDT